ncbi:NACHT domain-containing protein [Streptomyces sp. SP18ES09]|uniref:NACHT domain-containing protein n=1 Tax=Streptomyces sp. SP18ES09 TaxID=3002532 RepID=UPI002E7873A6|nr:NACHT domain-containing protein [Streptomyces sp. SP18ES09]MEE1817632.1 NACHT domain-containing protein [Streptomyces sp. SP18ES09]
MEPALIGTRLASAAIGPLLRKLLVSDGPGAGLTGPSGTIRLSSLVSFRGEKRTLTERDVRKLAGTLVARARAGGGEPPFPADETEAVTGTLATTLLALGDLDMDDAQAVHLGHRALARRLRAAAPAPDGLAEASVLFLDAVTELACRHILEFFTQRSAFVPRTLVEQTRGQVELGTKLDALTARVPHPDVRDADFERRYLAHLAKKHGRLTIHGIDLHHSPDRWPLDLAYLSLEATGAAPGPGLPDGTGHPGHPEQALRADLALARHDRVLLRGLAGSGKTTLVQWLTVSAAAEESAAGMAYLRGRVPFVLPLRTLTRHGERLPAPDRFLSAAGCPLTPPDGWADRVLAAGRAVVLVDGIDEIPPAERGRARDWIRGLLDAYEGNRWLVTSRPTAVRDDWLAPDGFTELTLSPMTRAEVTTFVRRWHRAAGTEAEPYEQPLLDALRTTGHVAQLATNPLMCGLVCALHRDRRGFLPRGRKALYEAALSMLLARRDRERDMGAPSGIALDEAPQIQLIQRLAYWLTLNGRTQLDRAHAEALVREAVPAVQEAAPHDPGEVFTHLLHRSGLLREPTTDTVEFVHRTFQDHLAAKALVDHWDIGVLVRNAADDQWEDVIRMAVGHARPRECAEILRELLKAADAARDRRIRLRLVLLAASALDHATEVSPEVRERVLARTAEVIPPRTPDEARELAAVGRLVLDLLPGPEGLSDEEAQLVVTAGTHIVSDAALPYLARFADHPALKVRSQLMWGWGRFEAGPYAEAVVARVSPDGLQYTAVDDDRADEILRLAVPPERLDVRGVSDGQLAALLARCDPRTLALTRYGRRPDLTALASLTRLEHLSLTLHSDADWRLGDLPVHRPLDYLSFTAWPSDGLTALRHRPGLGQLVLWETELTEPRWHQVAALTSVSGLTLRGDHLAACPEDVRVRGVEELLVICFNGLLPSLERLARNFPDLRILHLLAADPTGGLDVSPLAALPRLAVFSAAGVTLTGTEHLPPTVRIGT